ncbi:hypothetical protein BKA61DRAFT_677917 [Leptodontidium sp. MPI-SDFR-AT-0119]|nr:hypothetical protein BKA61DRAFT_677917 [Leptodontidium sp. MPI-SDFR-AT-0119]
MFPASPAFEGALRLARLSDITRIGVVAAASFYHSSCYRDSFRKGVLDPDSIVLVVEATLDQKESIHVYDALAAVYPPFDVQIPKDMLENGKAIAAAAIFSLLPHSPRHGQFQPQPEGGDPKTPDDQLLNRDKNPIASQIMDEVLHPKKIFKGRMAIDMMVTHPAYWRSGHATLIARWFIELAKLDGIGLGVAGLPWERHSSLPGVSKKSRQSRFRATKYTQNPYLHGWVF